MVSIWLCQLANIWQQGWNDKKKFGSRIEHRKLNSEPGPGQVIMTHNIFFSSFFHTVNGHYYYSMDKNWYEINNVIVYENVLSCLFPGATQRDNIRQFARDYVDHVEISEGIVKFSQFYLLGVVFCYFL